jgi:hypothetical protein
MTPLGGSALLPMRALLVACFPTRRPSAYTWKTHIVTAECNRIIRWRSRSREEPEQRALCRLLNSIVGSYIEAFDEEPLPVAVADSAYHRLLDLLASLDLRTNAERRLADMNNVAECELW